MYFLAYQSTTEGLSKMMVQVTFLRTVGGREQINTGSRIKLQNIFGLSKLIFTGDKSVFFL
jgi:hypothetical protein